MEKNILAIALLGTTVIISPIMTYASIFPTKQQTDKVQRQVLQRFELPGTNYKVCGMGITTFSPNSAIPHHKQNGPEVLYVLEGEIILMLDGQPAKTIKAGDSFQIPAGVLHTTKAGSKGAKVLATWVLKANWR